MCLRKLSVKYTIDSYSCCRNDMIFGVSRDDVVILLFLISFASSLNLTKLMQQLIDTI